ncbi:hypothetical protein D6777_03900 [Candidatus Woesearchaeota archaeon]|nr:MAG: hypothetical protein D6777_03900 [Candidatus Woesearchaeota archaeon]
MPFRDDKKLSCKQCGEPVDAHNNADYWDVLYHALCQGHDALDAIKDYLNLSEIYRASRAEHLFPVGDCKGNLSKSSMIRDSLYLYDLGHLLEEPVEMDEEYATYAKIAYELLQKL